ncbi:DUF455 domain protein [Rasamsonia emersonii CBS 393.64]|uniref:DUF455 domain protein n=1 Tax=Rasamsonia emersonii (strain ATCC 16479 / CBS 393.64 / IMI 116815) TaxID=1408163 RepID=A0A0F4YDD3_RASE3|nr:DUF455 domain protein [Rasamsonia emersonii CBS 393.64]KKA16202.1 DUF455 domain protein [Rasamsonia emersonii CBS 393.64]
MQGFIMSPPDQEGLTTGNKLAGKHPLGARARHLHTKGALIVRFEMPFAIWCTNCKPNEVLIGQGVRFNAEKKRVGNYYSTPIYSFRMKHTLCGGWIEIRTDPKNTAYVVTEGGRKRDTGEDKLTGEPGEIPIRLGPGDEAEKDAFARLEGKVQDQKQFETAKSRIEELQKRQDRDWEDPYEKSKRLRRAFREERKRLERADAANEALKDKMSLGIDLLEEMEEDRVRAGLVQFGSASSDDSARASRLKPMFETTSSRSPSSSRDNKRGGSGKRLKSEALAAERKALLSSELRGNTRAALDPFLNEGQITWQPALLKTRKTQTTPRDQVQAEPDGDGNGETATSTPEQNPLAEAAAVEVPDEKQAPAGQAATTTTTTTTTTKATPALSTALVNYGSDTE